MFGFILTLVGCSKEETVQAPALPPLESMQISFENFSTSKKGIAGNTNFNTAALHAVVWHSLIAGTLVVPMAAFNESFKHQAVVKDESRWAWPYDFSIGTMVYNAELGATFSNGVYDWQLRISKSAGFQNFIWITGTMNQNGSSGNWLIYESPLNPIAILKIEWSKNTDGSIHFVKYETLKIGSASYGSTLECGKNDITEFDTYFKITNNARNSVVEIEFNSNIHNGRIKDNLNFSDSDWHCWNYQKFDISCE